MTRPLGASFADWTGKSRHAGGIGVGDGTIVFILVALIVAGVADLTVSRADQVERRPTPASIQRSPAKPPSLELSRRCSDTGSEPGPRAGPSNAAAGYLVDVRLRAVELEILDRLGVVLLAFARPLRSSACRPAS